MPRTSMPSFQLGQFPSHASSSMMPLPRPASVQSGLVDSFAFGDITASGAPVSLDSRPPLPLKPFIAIEGNLTKTVGLLTSLHTCRWRWAAILGGVKVRKPSTSEDCSGCLTYRRALRFRWRPRPSLLASAASSCPAGRYSRMPSGQHWPRTTSGAPTS